MPHPILFVTEDELIPSQGYQSPTITLRADYPGHSKRMAQGTWLQKPERVTVQWADDRSESVVVYALDDTPMTDAEVAAAARAWAQTPEAAAFWRFMRTGERIGS